jgi:hypothetical protein
MKGLKTVLYNSNIMEKMHNLPYAQRVKFEFFCNNPMSNEARAVFITSDFPYAFRSLSVRAPSEFNFRKLTNAELSNVFLNVEDSFFLYKVFKEKAFSEIHDRLFPIMSDIQLEILVFHIFYESKDFIHYKSSEDFSSSENYDKYNEIILSILNNENTRHRLKDTFGLLYRTTDNKHFKAVLEPYLNEFSPPPANEQQRKEFHSLVSEVRKKNWVYYQKINELKAYLGIEENAAVLQKDIRVMLPNLTFIDDDKLKEILESFLLTETSTPSNP